MKRLLAILLAVTLLLTFGCCNANTDNDDDDSSGGGSTKLCEVCGKSGAPHGKCNCGEYLCDENHVFCYECSEIADYHGDFATDGILIHCPGCFENGIVHTQCNTCGDYLCINKDTHGKTCACEECETDETHHDKCPICNNLFSEGDHSNCRCDMCGMLHQFHEKCDMCTLRVCVLHVHTGDLPEFDNATYTHTEHVEWVNEHLFQHSMQTGWASAAVEADYTIAVNLDNGNFTLEYTRAGIIWFTFEGTYVALDDDKVSLTVTSGEQLSLSGAYAAFARPITGSAIITLNDDGTFAEDLDEYLKICHLCFNLSTNVCEKCEVCGAPSCVSTVHHCHGEHASPDSGGYCSECGLKISCEHENRSDNVRENDDGTRQYTCMDCGCYLMPEHDHADRSGDGYCDVCLDKIK